MCVLVCWATRCLVILDRFACAPCFSKTLKPCFYRLFVIIIAWTFPSHISLPYKTSFLVHTHTLPGTMVHRHRQRKRVCVAVLCVYLVPQTDCNIKQCICKVLTIILKCKTHEHCTLFHLLIHVSLSRFLSQFPRSLPQHIFTTRSSSCDYSK